MRAIFADFSRFLWPRSSETPAPLEPGPGITILSVLVEDRDRAVVGRLGQLNQWHMAEAESLDGARRLCARLHPQIVLLDRDAAGRDWRSLISDLAASSGACVVLVTSVLDDNLWNEVVCHGGYEILPKPLREEQVARTVRMARSFWATANKWASTVKKEG